MNFYISSFIFSGKEDGWYLYGEVKFSKGNIKITHECT